MATSIKYYEDQEVRDKTVLVPLPCYATFPLDGEGRHYKKLRVETNLADPSSIIQWEPGDWVVGVPITVHDKDTYKILKDYEDKVIRERINSSHEERCD